MKGMTMKDIYVEILKEWGGFKIGDIVRFGQTKGERIIEQGIGQKVKKQQEVNPKEPMPEHKKGPPKVETADAVLTVEKAIATPEITPKVEVKKEETKSKEK